jgi:uncharacterized membrane protein
MAEAIATGAHLPRIKSVPLDRPWAWLNAGWRDVTGAPKVSLAYGILFAAVGWVLTLGMLLLDAPYLVLPLAAGFMILGPLLAVGLYDVSRKRQRGETPTLNAALRAYQANTSQIALMGVALLLLFIAWVRIAALIFFLFFGLHPPSFELLIDQVFFSADSIGFLVFGTLVGGLLAAFAFALSAISIPYLLDRPHDHVINAIGTSFRAIGENLYTMAFWAVLIVVFMAAGLVTFYIGLIFTLPLIGHATWHAYRDLVE